MFGRPPDVAHNPSCARYSCTETMQACTVEGDAMDRSIADFLGYLQDRNRSPLTILRYGETLRRFVAFAREELHHDEIRAEDVDKALVVAFVREGGSRGARPSASTRNSRLSALKAFFRWLVAEEQLVKDPTKSVERAELPERSPTFLTPEEFGRLREAVERTATEHYHRRDLAILVTLWHTGLRLRELLSLNLDQVDFAAERLVAVRRKGGRIVDVHFNVEVTIALRRWLWMRRSYTRANEEPALFLSDRGRRLSPRAVEDLVAKYARAAGFTKRVTPHSLRHSTATAMISHGVPIEVVALHLDHRSLDTTRGYVHLAGEQVHAAVATLASESRRRVAGGK